MASSANKLKTVVLSGAGYSGKTTVLKLLLERLSDQVIGIPETVQMLAKSDLPFPLPRDLVETYRREYINMIIGLQNELEVFLKLAYHDRYQALVLDRGIPDTIAYHPDPLAWFQEHRTFLLAELNRYDQVILLEVSESDYASEEDRPYRYEEARRHESLLKQYYRYHSNFAVVPSYDDVEQKYKHVVSLLFPDGGKRR